MRSPTHQVRDWKSAAGSLTLVRQKIDLWPNKVSQKYRKLWRNIYWIEV